MTIKSIKKKERGENIIHVKNGHFTTMPNEPAEVGQLPNMFFFFAFFLKRAQEDYLMLYRDELAR